MKASSADSDEFEGVENTRRRACPPWEGQTDCGLVRFVIFVRFGLLTDSFWHFADSMQSVYIYIIY